MILNPKDNTVFVEAAFKMFTGNEASKQAVHLMTV